MIGWVDEDKQRDTLYCFTKTDEEEVFAIERPGDGIEVRLRAGEPSSGHKRIPDGVYFGNLVRCDFEPGRDYFCLEATLPKAQIEELQRALKSNPALEIDVSVHLLSFSYEVDDALREWHHSRGLIVRDLTIAPVHCVTFSHSPAASGQALITTSDPDHEDEEKIGNGAQSSEPVTITQLMQTISTQLANVSQSGSRITIALWVGIAVLVLANL